MFLAYSGHSLFAAWGFGGQRVLFLLISRVVISIMNKTLSMPNKMCVLTSWLAGDISGDWVILGSTSKFLIPFIGIIVSVVCMLVDVFHRVGLCYS